MTKPHFLVIAIIAISQLVTANRILIQLWNTSFAEGDNSMPITRHTSVYLRCSEFPEPMTTRWTFIRPGEQMLVTTFSDTLEIRRFNESHVGNYQCRVFPSSGPEIWRSITLCREEDGRNESASDESSGPTCSEMSRSSQNQVIKFNRLRKSDGASEQQIDSEITDLRKLETSQEIKWNTNIRLECPFDKKKDSLIWIVHSRLEYKQLDKYNNGSVNILNVDRVGQYDCLVKNSVGHVRHSFVVRAGPIDNHGTAGPIYKNVELMISISCIVFFLFTATETLIKFLRSSKRGAIRERIPSPQPSMTIDVKEPPTTCSDLLDGEEVSQSVKTCSESDVRSPEEFDSESHENADYTPWELRLDNLILGDILGESDFYMLYRARLVNLLPERSINVVAKMSRGTEDIDVLALVSETEIMKSVGRHVNVICLLGTSTQTDALFFVMEFAEHGNLRDHLHGQGSSLGYEYIHESESESGRLSVRIGLVSYALQVAKGMDYLASKRCIHRDLRTKHVLISKGGILKIADYATKRIRGKNVHRSSVRWMAPETLFRGIHTTEANVWSYGILLWEIMTFAETPYPSILTTEELVARLKLGYYMENPNHCPEDIYKLMKRCWNENPGERPQFHKIVEHLDGMLQDLSDQLKRLESDNH